MRAKDEFPWFRGWDEANHAFKPDFGGNRWNDLHYTRAAKELARARQRGEG